MKRPAARNGLATPDTLTSAELEKRFRYELFDSVCQIVQAGCAKEDLPRFRRQRAALERKFGYDRLPKTGRRQRSSK